MNRVRPNQVYNGPIVQAASKGQPLPDISVVSSAELKKWTELAMKEQLSAEALKKSQTEKEAKKQISTSREVEWNNTISAMRTHKEALRQERMDKEEERRKLIDQEEQELQEQRSARIVDQANEKLYRQDHRFLNLESGLLLHEVLKERQEQVQLSARKKEMSIERQRKYDDEVIRLAKEEEEGKRRKKMEGKHRALAERDARIQQIEDIKQKKIAEKHKTIEEGKRLREEAEKETERERKVKEEQRLSARKAAAENLEHMLMSSPKKKQQQDTPLTPRRLQEQTYDHSLSKDIESHEQRVARREQLTSELRETKRKRRDELINSVSESFSAAMTCSPSRREVTASNFETLGMSMNEQLLSNDESRLSAREAMKKDCFPSYQAQTERRERIKQLEKEKNERMSENLKFQTRRAEEEELMEKLAKKEEENRLAQFHTAQKRQKDVNDSARKENELKEGTAMISMTKKEDALMEQYLRGKLPPSAEPAVRKKVVPPRKALRAS